MVKTRKFVFSQKGGINRRIPSAPPRHEPRYSPRPIILHDETLENMHQHTKTVSSFPILYDLFSSV